MRILHDVALLCGDARNRTQATVLPILLNNFRP